MSTSYAPGKTQESNNLALGGMVAGIVGMLGILICCCSPIIASGWFGLLGIPALVLGYMAKQQIETTGGSESDKQKAMTAMVLGGIEIGFAACTFAIFLLSLLGYVALPAADSLF